ncbi:CCCH zinc finger protein [Nitrosomonas aestuarii]|uniref:CCCH zinc finger protein n=1 Tax=Nitrosomonas aestuarii TaxID=52441 RepID=UPI000D32764C|nr:CCCH zinc finger protein [Nitrosomonas aestuarii]PTN10768.1 TRM13 CCCH zinc finger protein [Nitrosomonas aestuarii]
MRGQVNCKLIGGPQGDLELTLSTIACKERISLMGDVWVAQGLNGGVLIMKGSIPPSAPWLTYIRDIYEKVKLDKPGLITYQFVCTEEVNRCEKILEGKDRRCRNEAVQDERFCKTHIKNI